MAEKIIKELQTIITPENKGSKTTLLKKFPKEVFGAKVNKQAIFDAIMFERSSKRQGTHKVKSRAESSGSGMKPWKQKGTGRARAGSKRSPIWVGGGRAFGPTVEKKYALNINKKIRRIALASAFTLKLKEKSVIVRDVNLEKISTKEIIKLIKNLKLTKLQRKILFITESEIIFKSVANIPDVETVKINSISVEKVINANIVVLSNIHINALVEAVK